MKRCAQLDIWRAIKCLRKAQKNTASIWASAIDDFTLSLEMMLVYTEGIDLLDQKSIDRLAKHFKSKEEISGKEKLITDT
jgi:hypothetical protein